MASNAEPPTKQTFIIWAPDYPDVFEQRLAARVEHIERAKRPTTEGFIS